MKKSLNVLVSLFILMALPMLGIFISGKSPEAYLEFPPKTKYVEHAPFSWPAFFIIAGFVLVSLLPFVLQGLKSFRHSRPAVSICPFLFPTWGWAGLALTVTSWIIAWNRFPLLEPLQSHTFTPLWLGYIITVSALTCARKRNCLLQNPKAVFLLFMTSALFWWFFEYLNRFIQNWFYLNVADYTAATYFTLATISFSTVLPAILSTNELLETFPFWRSTFGKYEPLKDCGKIVNRKDFLKAILITSLVTLLFLGIFPNLLFSIIWMSPLFILCSVRQLLNRENLFSYIAQNNWTPLVTSAIAAMICGFFWEMWNFYSEAKWVYEVPYVNRFHLFEMPILGFTGYIPFGWECLVIGNIVLKYSSSAQE